MSTETETTLRVEGMGCQSCVGHVGEALRALAGVHDVEVRLAEGIALVRHDAGRPSAEAMVAAVRDAGYEGAPQA